MGIGKSRGEVNKLIYVIPSTFPVKEICHMSQENIGYVTKDSSKLGYVIMLKRFLQEGERTLRR